MAEVSVSRQIEPDEQFARMIEASLALGERSNKCSQKFSCLLTAANMNLGISIGVPGFQVLPSYTAYHSWCPCQECTADCWSAKTSSRINL
jgi:hypothetical protein